VTLNTSVVVCEPTDPKALFSYLLDLLGRGVNFDPKWEYTPRGASDFFEDSFYMSAWGQGLPAWLWLWHADDAPLTVEGFDDEWAGPKPWFCEHLICVSFDTGYGYRGPGNASCGDLHAWLVTETVAYLADRNITKVVWHDERGVVRSARGIGGWHEPGPALLELGNPDVGRLPEHPTERANG
jgi:hypothetical protein